jgi:predicted TIM-barrel fold metal-dependent hydrolase
MSSNRHPVPGYEPLDVVDTQLHLSLELTEEKILAAMDALGIRSVLIDELWAVNAQMQGIPCAVFANGVTRPLSPYAQAAAIKHPQRFAYIQRVERRDPDLAAHLATLASSPGCKALRLVLMHPLERQAFASGQYHELLVQAQRYDFPVCIFAQDVGALMAGAAANYPGVRFILDHCGWPKSAAQWDSVLQLAGHGNVYLKWSHAFRPFRRGDHPAEALQHEFMRAIEAFGADRIIWASDITHEETDASWAQLLGFVQDNPALSLQDKRAILGLTARRLFRWEAPAAQDADKATELPSAASIQGRSDEGTSP